MTPPLRLMDPADRLTLSLGAHDSPLLAQNLIERRRPARRDDISSVPVSLAAPAPTAPSPAVPTLTVPPQSETQSSHANMNSPARILSINATAGFVIGGGARGGLSAGFNAGFTYFPNGNIGIGALFAYRNITDVFHILRARNPDQTVWYLAPSVQLGQSRSRGNDARGEFVSGALSVPLGRYDDNFLVGAGLSVTYGLGRSSSNNSYFGMDSLGLGLNVMYSKNPNRFGSDVVFSLDLTINPLSLFFL